jgi:hypothetical protein
VLDHPQGLQLDDRVALRGLKLAEDGVGDGLGGLGGLAGDGGELVEEVDCLLFVVGGCFEGRRGR